MALSPDEIREQLRLKKLGHTSELPVKMSPDAEQSPQVRSTSESAAAGAPVVEHLQEPDPETLAKIDKAPLPEQASPESHGETEPRPIARSERAVRARSTLSVLQPAEIKTLPHSLEAEKGVLGSMMVPYDGEGERAIAIVREQIGADAFYNPAHQIIFRAILDMNAAGAPVNLITLGEHLRSVGQEQNAGGPAYYTEISGFVPSAVNLPYYLDAVKNKATQRELIRTSLENARQANEPDCDVAALLAVAHQRLEMVERASSRFGRLPNLADISVLLNGARPPRPAELVNGLLHQGSKLIVGGTSKGRKTFSLIDLAVSVATGAPWWGFETAQGPVCYINFEIQESFFVERVADICRVKKVTVSKDMFMGWNLRGHSEGMENLTEEIVAKIISRHFALVVFDPIYKGLGDRDENKAGDVASLMNQLERVAVKTGAAIAFGAHYSKGNQAAKESIDRIGGSGVFARDPDSILTMTAHEEPEAFTVDCTLRNFPPIEPFVLRWEWPLFIRTDLDPEALKQPRKRGGEYSVRYNKEALLEELSVIEGVRPGALFRKVAEAEGISRAQFYRLAKQLRDDGRISEKDGLWFRANIKKEHKNDDQ